MCSGSIMSSVGYRERIYHYNNVSYGRFLITVVRFGNVGSVNVPVVLLGIGYSIK